MRQIKLYDTTLRDGSQREGLSFSVEDKLKIARELDKLGIHYIEGGWPGSNPKDIDFFKRIKKEPLVNAKVVAFGSTRRKNTKAEDDVSLKALAEAGTDAVCIFGKSWDVHVEHALKTSLAENLDMIRDSIVFFKNRGLEVVYDAEHFFDGFKNHSEYALNTLQVAAEAGADWIVLCDTNGGTLPLEIGDIVENVKAAIDTPLGIHAHNDADCAEANSLIAVSKGVDQVHGTVNGYGERCGNANMCSIIPSLALKLRLECVSDDQLKLLTEASHMVSEIANLTPDPHQPYVGHSAFAHKAGVHVSAINRQHAYEHVEPELVGNAQRVIVSELSGKSTIVLKAQELGIDLSDDPERVSEILQHIKELEHVGYYFEAADGSFELLLRKATDLYKQFFKLESFRVIMEKRKDGKVVTEATIKLHVGGRRVIATGEGNGPVNALDRALRDAIGQVYPNLADIQLTDYKVRVLDAKKGTGAVTRVLIETSDGSKSWGTVGVSENIIEASWQALADSIEYGLMHKKNSNAD